MKTVEKIKVNPAISRFFGGINHSFATLMAYRDGTKVYCAYQSEKYRDRIIQEIENGHILSISKCRKVPKNANFLFEYPEELHSIFEKTEEAQ